MWKGEGVYPCAHAWDISKLANVTTQKQQLQPDYILGEQKENDCLQVCMWNCNRGRKEKPCLIQLQQKLWRLTLAKPVEFSIKYISVDFRTQGDRKKGAKYNGKAILNKCPA